MLFEDKIIKDPGELPFIIEDIQNNRDRKKAEQFVAAVQAWFCRPEEKTKKMVKQIQAFSVSTDFARVSSAAWNIFQQMQAYDNFWDLAFKKVPVAKGDDNWEIHDVSNGVAVKKVPEGHRLEVQGIAGTKSTVYIEKRGGALGWTDEMIRFRKVAAMVDKAEIIRNKYYENKRNEHYNLIAAAAPAGGANSNVTTYQGAVTDTRANRILQTIDAGNYALGNRCKNKGYSNLNVRLLFLPESMRQDAEQARKLVERSAITTNSQKEGQYISNLTWPVSFYYTWSTYVPANTGFLVIPGNKIQRNENVAPFMLTDQDILQLTYVMALWAYYGAAIGDTDQVQRVQFE